MEDEEKASESLELDKLEVPDKPAESEEATPPSSEDTGKPEQPASKKISSWISFVLPAKNKVFVLAKDKVFILSLLAGMVAASLILFYPVFQKHLFKPQDNGFESAPRISYAVSSIIGDDHHVKFKLSVPFRDKAEKHHLMRRLPDIKEELSVCGSLPKVAQIIREKDLDGLRKEILRIINDLTGVPVEELSVEGLSLQ